MPRDWFRVRPSNLSPDVLCTWQEWRQTHMLWYLLLGGRSAISARMAPDPAGHSLKLESLRDLGQLLPATRLVSAPSRCAITSHRFWR